MANALAATRFLLARWPPSALWLAGLLVASPGVLAAEPRAQGVLILLPGQPTGTQTGIDAFARGMRSALVDLLPPNSSIYVEYTDLARLKTPDAQAKLRDWYTAKYAGSPLDLIISGGQETRAFLARFRVELWPDIPIIFAGMDERSLSHFAIPPGTAVLTTRYDEEGTIRAALAALPDTEHAALVTGASPLDRYLRGLWLDALARAGDRLRLIDLAGLPLDQLRGRLAALPPHTVIFYSSTFTDGAGRALILPEVVPDLAAAANRPMFAIHDSLLGLGIVGGSLADYAMMGRQAGQLAAEVLAGAPLPDFPVKTSGVNKLLFDWHELRRWGIDERLLPAGSAVRYRSPSAWELYRWPILIALSVLVAQGLLIAALLVQLAQRARIQRQLDEQYRFETFLSSLSRFFADVPAEGIDREIQAGLARVGEFLGMDRVSLFELSPLGERARIIASWSTDALPRAPAEVSPALLPWMTAQITAGRVVALARRDDLPPEAATDRTTFAALGCASYAAIPLVEEAATRRVLALGSAREERAWPPALIDRLRLIAEVLSQILARKHAELESRESRAVQQAMLGALPSRMAVLDRDGRVLAVNRAWLDPAQDGGEGLMARAGVGTSYLEVCAEAALAGEAGARAVATALGAVLAGTSEMVEVEYSVKGPGQERWYRLSVMGLGKSRGGAVVARNDVTDQVLSRETLRQFSQHLLTAQEEERRRVGRELHDDLNQRLVLLGLEIAQLVTALPDPRGVERIRHIGERVDAIAADVHQIAYRLHPFKLEYLGLAGAARGLCTEVAAAHDLVIAFTEHEVPASLPRDVALCAYRVLQEALSNVVKHSGSARATVRLAGEHASLRVTVRDFGAGMPPETPGAVPGLGLASMRERLRVVNGRLVVNGTAAPGTELSATIPLPAGRSAR